MKLWLQLLFAQGWLWRQRFPEHFASASVQHRGLGTYVLLILPVALVVLTLESFAAGQLSRGILVALVAGTWFLWTLSSRGLRADASRKALRISAMWALGFFFCTSVIGLLAVALVRGDWWLLALAFALILCWVTGWLRAVQRSYLLFRYPGKYAWMLKESQQQPRGLMAPYADAIAETYWRLPSQILFPKRERHAH